jgi:hypothetical protein
MTARGAMACRQLAHAPPAPTPPPTPHAHCTHLNAHQAALKSAALIVERLLDREKDMNGGKYPETIALVLWGTDNIKTYGESLAQVRRGAACVWDWRRAAVTVTCE